MKFLILGAGNMACALIPKTFNSNAHHYTVATPGETSALEFAKNFGVTHLEYKSALKKLFNGEFDVLWLAMKPQSFYSLAQDDFFKDVKKELGDKTHVISILAAVEVESLKSVLGANHITRIMPNTPTEVGMGVNPIWSTTSDSVIVTDLLANLNKVGKAFVVQSEEALDLITPFTGSGPAYFFEIARILENKLQGFGFTPEISRSAIAMTLKGAAQMLLDSDKSSQELRENVTSKKGVTYEALKVLEEANIEKIFSSAIDKALHRIKELKSNK